MKTFFDAPEHGIQPVASWAPTGRPERPSGDSAKLCARIAVYDALTAAPQIQEIESVAVGDFIGLLASETYRLARDVGGDIPYTVIREIVENLIHADFREAVVSILPGGREIRFADQGPGIPDKKRAVLPGYTTAKTDMKRHIRGVGSGFPIVREFLGMQEGELQIEDNLGTGTVVTIRSGLASTAGSESHGEDADETVSGVTVELAGPRLTTRQQKVLSLVMEYGDAGPSIISRELAVGLSTAHRDLAFLEGLGLIASDESGKRRLTESGAAYLGTIFG